MTTDFYAQKIATELKVPTSQVQATLSLLDEDCTIPFIARYRKEATGSLDEVVVTAIRDLREKYTQLDKRREAMVKSLKERDLLNDELLAKLNASLTLNDLEDIYLPFKPKRKTKASVAREKGLEPLASEIFNFKIKDVKKAAEAYVDAEKGVESVDAAIGYARDIMAEWMSEQPEVRQKLRQYWSKNSIITSKMAKGKEQEGQKFKDYFDWSEKVTAAPSHRILAMLRGEGEGILKLTLKPDDEEALIIMDQKFLKGDGECGHQIELTVEDAYDRLLAPSMETELRGELKKRADIDAINVFTKNLRELLMAPPLGQKSIIALDPGFRTGCKLVCLGSQGDLLHHDVIYPHMDGSGDGAKQAKLTAEKKLVDFAKKHQVAAIAVGNGTAGRETEEFLRSIDWQHYQVDTPQIVMVNESGASIYSASEVAREEFPDYDLTVRGAVSIGRRLMDPLAELVKLDPKSIGVGQYQHDVDQPALQSSLDDTVISCVNSVGVELNTASKQLLSYVSGLGNQIATNIVKHRQENGPFKARTDLKKVARLGPKAFEQSAGFLRINDAKNPLDSSAVHPESYKVVEAMAKDLGVAVADLISNAELRKRIDLNKYVTDKIGIPTLRDILQELEKPGRDPRATLEPMKFADGVHSIGDLKEGMKLPGIITNVTAFGAFVDVGVHQDGLVHVSELTNKFVKDPSEVVTVQQKVQVTVLQVDKDRKRISLSMKR
ncbi:MAG: RNA-binding transcriptional accessory protein [Candidatus Obscuribacter sp.]|nr:RNA-binding transcriptional accessory protein [Candidatus Obscuribacter sp.]MBK9618907.1 RNA-binding transcriptional accessory protein [Candidatus Obscuribacter sp.]